MAGKNKENIIDYVQKEMQSFDEKPFNNVDSLVLSQLSYTHFNGLVKGLDKPGRPVKLWELLKAEKFGDMFSTVLNGDKTKKLLYAMVASPRFRDITVNFYVEDSNAEKEQQFSGVVFFLPKQFAYIAFRGTDTTLLGWKEDFNMAFMNTVPSQVKAEKTVNAVAELTDMPLVIGGHSKGGNLAVYSAVKCRKEVKDRILAVYCHDGPGFKKGIIGSKEYGEISDRIRKTVPYFSLIGMLLQHQENYQVVVSDEKFLQQHDPFSWGVDDGDFAYADGISTNANILNASICQWLEQIDFDSREKFVDVLFKVLCSTGAKRVKDLEGNRYNNAVAFLETLKGLDKDTRKFLFKTVNLLASISLNNFVEETKKVAIIKK